jgi:hypothetical protein
MYKKLSLVFLGSLIGMSCHKNIQPTNALIGRWEWIKSIGGITGGDLQTPQSHGSMTLIFINDSTYAWEINGNISLPMRYEQKPIMDLQTGRYTEGLTFYNQNREPLHPFKWNRIEQQLILQENKTDGYDHYYQKKTDE